MSLPKIIHYGCPICKNTMDGQTFYLEVLTTDAKVLNSRISDKEFGIFRKNQKLLQTEGYYYCVNSDCINNKKAYFNPNPLIDEELKKLLLKLINREEIKEEILESETPFRNIRDEKEEERDKKEKERQKQLLVDAILSDGKWIKSKGVKPECANCGIKVGNEICFSTQTHNRKYYKNYYLCNNCAKAKQNEPRYKELTEKEENKQAIFDQAYDEVVLITRYLSEEKIAKFSQSERALFIFMKNVKFTGDFAFALKSYPSFNHIYRALLNEAKKYQDLRNYDKSKEEVEESLDELYEISDKME